MSLGIVARGELRMGLMNALFGRPLASSEDEVAIASMVERHWYHYFLHNQCGQMLTALLLFGGVPAHQHYQCAVVFDGGVTEKGALPQRVIRPSSGQPAIAGSIS